MTTKRSSRSVARGARLTGRSLLLDLALIGLVGLVLRALLVANGLPALVTRDSEDYFVTGYLMAEGEFDDIPYKRPPLYPLFLAGIITLFGPSLGAIALVQHALGLATAAMIYLLGRLAFGRAIGLAAGLLTALNGALLVAEHLVLSEALMTPLLTAAVLLLFLAVRSGRAPLFLVGGLTLGLCALVRPAAPAIVPLAIGAVLVQPRPRYRRVLGSLLVAVGALLVAAPWLAYKQTKDDTAAGGLGHSLFSRVRRHDPTFEVRDLAPPPADPEARRLRERVFQLARRHDYPRLIATRLKEEFDLSDAEADAALRDFALQLIRQEPDRYLLGTALKFLELLERGDKAAYQQWDTSDWVEYARAYPRDIRFVFDPFVSGPPANIEVLDVLINLYRDGNGPGVLVMMLFPIGAATCLLARRNRVLALIPLIVLTQILIHVALNGVLIRYRYPYQPLITLTAVAGIPLFLAWAHGLLQTALRRPGRLTGAAQRAR
jgi:hypothetical protein